jgi:hypothetical protein
MLGRAMAAKPFDVEEGLRTKRRLAPEQEYRPLYQADIESLLASRELSAHSTAPTDPKTTTIATIMTGGMASRPSIAPSSTATMGRIKLIVESR